MIVGKGCNYASGLPEDPNAGLLKDAQRPDWLVERVALNPRNP